MRIASISLAAAAVLLGPTMSESAAKVTVKESTLYYSVNGRTGKEIYAQIVRKGPKLSGKKGTHVATTTMSFDSRNVRVEVRGTRCVVSNADVHVTVTYRIPKWNGRGSAKLQRAWDKFLEHVWRHEKQHRDIGLEYARRLESGAKNVSGDARRSCAGFEEATRKFASRNRAWHERKQRSFDASWFGDGGRQYKYDRALIAAE